MKYEEIEPRMAELDEVGGVVGGTLDRARNELIESQIEFRFTRQFSEIESFLSSTLLAAKEAKSQEELVSKLVSGLTKIQEYVRNESQRLRERVPAMRERVAVLESVSGFIKERKGAHESRKQAIERVTSEEESPGRPERIAVVREAEKLRKSRKQVDS